MLGVRLLQSSRGTALKECTYTGLNVLLNNTGCVQPWLATRLADHVRYLSLLEVCKARQGQEMGWCTSNH